MLSSGIGARIASLLRNLWTNKSAENHDHPVVGSSESQQTSPTENAPNSLGTVGKLLRSLSGRKGRPQDSVAEKDDTPNVSPHIDSLTDHPSSPQVRTTSKTIAETASILLKLLSAVADAAPWTPLKPIVTGMEILFAQYEKRGENDEELERLRESLFRLSLKLEELKTMPKSVTYLLKILTPTLNVIQQKIENFPKDSLLSSIFHANQNAKTIADISRMISDIVDDILMHLSIVTFKHTNDLFNIVTASLQTEKLKELIKAKDAMELRGCGREPCYPGTRLPILKEIITDWIPSSTSERVFCLSGPSGSGKTTLALTIFDQVKEEGRLPCATFFCSSLSEDASNPHNIFPTLAAQLALLEDIYPIALAELDRGLLDMYETSNMRHQTLLVKLLEEIGKGRNTLLVIDGLDECKHKDEAARVVETLLKIIADIPSVKLLISCSTNSDVHSRLSGEVLVHELSLEDIPSSDKNHDMRILLAVELGTSIAQENMVRLFEDVEQANCSFLVALMACKAVVQKQSFEMQRAAFKGSLNAQEQCIYHGFIERAYPEGADDDARQRFTAALVIVAFGRNSLNVTTLNRLLGFSGDGLLVQHFFVEFPERILSIQLHMVRICHPLFQAYLKSGEVDERFGSQHLYITKLLLEFMNDSLDRCRSGTVTRKDRSLDETEQILLYACRYWPNHLDKVDTMISGTESIQDLVRMMQDFFHNKLLYWLEVLLGLDDLGLIASVLRKLLAWTEKHCRSDAVFRIVADALTLFELSKEALKRPAFGHENAQSRVYRIFLLSFTHSGQRMAKLFRHIKIPVEIYKVPCYRKQVISLSSVLSDADGVMPKICLSRDANRFALAHKGCLEITDSSTNICSVIWKCDVDSQTIVDALFVGEDHILITTKSTRTGFVEVRPRKISSNMDGKALVQQEYVSESQVLPLLALSSDGSTIAIMTQSKVEFWLTEKWEQRMPIQCREGAGGKSRALALSGHHVLVGLKLKPMKSSNGARKGSVRIKFDGKIVCAAFSADGNLLVVAGEYSISIYSSLLAQSPLPGLLLPIVIATSSPLDRIVLSPRAQYLAATGVCSLTVWKVPSDAQTAREPLMTLQSSEPQRQMLSAVVFPKDDRYLHCAHVCSGSRDICFGIRDMEVPSSAQMPVSALAISSDGKVATGSISGFVAVWNPTMRKVLPTWQMKDRHLGPVISLAFSPDDEYLASVSEKVVHITSAAGEVLKLGPSDGRFHFPCAFSGSSAFFLCTVKPAYGAAFARIVDIRSNQARDIHADNFDFVENVHSIALSASADILAINTTAGWLYLYRLLGSAATTLYRKQLGLLDCLSFTLDDQHVRSAVGAFSVDRLKLESSLRAPTLCVRDGWLVDSNGNLTCSLPSEEIDQWASNASTLVFCTKTLGNIVLVSIRSFEEGLLE